MARSNSPSIITIKLPSFVGRIAMLLPMLLALAGAWYATRWYVGNTIAEYASMNEDGGIELARMATRWAPDDAFVHFRLGALAERNFSANNLSEAVREYRLAVSLSPNDFRYWGELAHALEASGDTDAAEKASGRAVELAPNYAFPRWYMGNLLLRTGKYDEAFPQLVKAAQADGKYQSQVFNLAWQVFNGDVNEITRIVCPSPELRILFAGHLVGMQRTDDAMRIWSSISSSDQKTQRELGEGLEKQLMAAKQFRAALKVMQDIEPEGSQPPAAEQIVNGGLEGSRTLRSNRTFDWIVGTTPLAQISLDTQAHSGKTSLRVVFRAPSKLDMLPVSQTVVVEPNTDYHFECFARTRELNSGSPPIIVIFDPTDNTWLAGSRPLPTGSNEWQKLEINFKTKPGHDGVAIMFGQLPCTVGEVCPVFGTVWYDDFNLKRVSGAGPGRATAGGTPAGSSDTRTR